MYHTDELPLSLKVGVRTGGNGLLHFASSQGQVESQVNQLKVFKRQGCEPASSALSEVFMTVVTCRHLVSLPPQL